MSQPKAIVDRQAIARALRTRPGLLRAYRVATCLWLHHLSVPEVVAMVMMAREVEVLTGEARRRNNWADLRLSLREGSQFAEWFVVLEG